MKKPRWKPSAEGYTLIAMGISLVAAGVATKVPLIAFGSFERMAAVLIASDLVLYASMKLGIVRGTAR